jgi:MFS family permease
VTLLPLRPPADERVEYVPPPQRSDTTRFLGVWLPSFLTPVALSLVTFGLNWWLAGTPGGGARLGVVVGIANLAAVVVVAVLSGTLDRVRRSRSALVILLCSAGCVAAADLVFLHGATFPMLVVATACYVAMEVLRSTYLAVMETTSIDLAPRHWPVRRTATLVQSQQQIERIAAPALGGVLIGAGALYALPIAGVLLLAVVLGSLVISFRHFDTAGLDRHVSPGRWPRSMWQDVRSSLTFIRGDRELVFVLVLGVLVNLVAYPFYSLLPAYITRYGLGTQDAAALYGKAAFAYGVGLTAGTLLMVRAGRRGGRVVLDRAAFALATICLVLLATTTLADPIALLVAMPLVGVLIMVMTATTGAIWLDRTPADVRVRVFSVRRLIIFVGIPLGTSLIGFGGTAFGYPSYLRIHLCCVLAVLAVAWVIRRQTSLRSEAQRESSYRLDS